MDNGSGGDSCLTTSFFLILQLLSKNALLIKESLGKAKSASVRNSERLKIAFIMNLSFKNSHLLQH